MRTAIFLLLLFYADVCAFKVTPREIRLSNEVYLLPWVGGFLAFAEHLSRNNCSSDHINK